jgi:rod shape-determining protein MreD
VAGTLTGATIGLLQDALTGGAIGVNGIAKALIGYIAASIGVRVDVENLTTRILMNFVLSLLQSAILYGIESRLLGLAGLHVLWRHELLRATLNAAVAVPLFLLLDTTTRTE